VACAGFAFLRGSAVQRVVFLCLVPVAIVAVFAFIPAAVLERMVSFSASESGASAEALESSDARRYLLEKGLRYTAEFPLFGVGPGQFPSYEGSHNKVYGEHGMWHQAHNAWVQVSSECGIPAAIFFLGGYISSFLLLNRTFRKASRRPDCRDIRNTTFCVMLGMVGFCTAISFLNFAYFYYGPAIAGIAISLWRAANYEFEHRGKASRQPAACCQPALLHGNLTEGQP
jgi:O-antigen ligase